MTPYTVRQRVGAHKQVRTLSEWLRRYATELAGMMGDPLAWQLMLERWEPKNILEEATTTVVGARAAKTVRMEMCYTGDGVLEVDVKLLEGGGRVGMEGPTAPCLPGGRGRGPLGCKAPTSPDIPVQGTASP